MEEELVRDPIRSLIGALTSNDQEEIERALLTASLLLERGYLQQCVRLALDDEGTRDSLPSDYAARRSAEIEADFREYEAMGLLPGQFTALVPSDGEMELVCRALLKLLDGSPMVVGSAASALAYCARLSVVPKLAHAVRRFVAEGPPAATVAEHAIGTLGRVLITSLSGSAPTKEQAEILTYGLDALSFAAHAPAASPGTRDAGARELTQVEAQLGRSA